MIRLAALLAASLLASTAASAATVVTADRYLDVNTGRYVEHPAIFIGNDGRISSIADARTVRWGADVTHVDMSGKTLVPGLIDMHVHLDGPADIGGYRGLEYTDSFWQATAVGNARAMLDAGFTTVRNVGSGNRNDIGLMQAIRDGYAVGPRIVPAGYALGATGGHCDSTFLPPSLEKPKKEEGVGDGVEELRHQVRRQRKYRRRGDQGLRHRRRLLAQYRAGPAAADRGRASRHRRRGAPVGRSRRRPCPWRRRHQGRDPRRDRHDRTCQPGRCRGDQARQGAQAAGVVRNGYLQHRIYPGRGRKNGVLEDNLRKDREIAQIQRDGFRAAHNAGVRMVFASDAGVMPHGQIGRQFATMVTYGMTPLQAIQAATRNAAEALGRERDVGAIEVGRYGDLVAVTGDPTQNVRLLEKPDAVVKGGALILPAR